MKLRSPSGVAEFRPPKQIRAGCSSSTRPRLSAKSVPGVQSLTPGRVGERGADDSLLNSRPRWGEGSRQFIIELSRALGQ